MLCFRKGTIPPPAPKITLKNLHLSSRFPWLSIGPEYYACLYQSTPNILSMALPSSLRLVASLTCGMSMFNAKLYRRFPFCTIRPTSQCPGVRHLPIRSCHTVSNRYLVPVGRSRVLWPARPWEMAIRLGPSVRETVFAPPH